MLYSIRGKVIEKGNNFLVIENSGIGYDILVSNPDSFVLEDEIFLYLYHHIKEDSEYLVGFSTKDEMNAFKLLLHVNGIGPKTATAILSKISCNQLLTAISNNDLEILRSVPGISERVSQQIYLDLKDYISKSSRENVVQYKEVKEALKSLKFKVKDIDKVLPNIYIANGTTEDIIKEALRRLQNAKNIW